MKKFNQIFIVAACMLLGILSSCSYLDVVPDEKATEKDAFEDKDAAKRFVYSCYAYIPNPRSGTSSLDLFTSDEVVTAFEHETFAAFPKVIILRLIRLSLIGILCFKVSSNAISY